MPEPPEILMREALEKSRLFRVEQAKLRFSNGVERTYEYLTSGKLGAVIIVPMLDDDTVLLVEEFGIGLNRYEWGLPKGKVDEGETLTQAANRELKEEAGYGARDLILLKCLSQSPNYMQHRTQIVLARDLYPEKLEGDEPEPMSVKAMPINDIAAIAAMENVTEARTIAALYLARDWLNARS
ncbi:ADP compounds hydrolase NudE [Thalassocella blandensis]|nr:ADP compounds hydrolase NudE [Thalassocella blandensis]